MTAVETAAKRARGGSTAGILGYFEERTDEAARRNEKIGGEGD